MEETTGNVGEQIFSAISAQIDSLIPLGVTAVVSVMGFMISVKLAKKFINRST